MKYSSSEYQLIGFITAVLMFFQIGCENKGSNQPVRTMVPQRSEDFLGVWHSQGDTIQIYRNAQGDWFYVKNPFSDKPYKYSVFIGKDPYFYGSSASYDWVLKVQSNRGDQIKSMTGRLEISSDKSLMRVIKEVGPSKRIYNQDFQRIINKNL